MSSTNPKYYTSTHEWIQYIGDRTFRIGMSEFACKELEHTNVHIKPMYVYVKEGDMVLQLEMYKCLTNVLAPFDGVVTIFNPQMTGTIHNIHEVKEDYACLFMMESDFDPEKLPENFLTSEEYNKRINEDYVNK